MPCARDASAPICWHGLTALRYACRRCASVKRTFLICFHTCCGNGPRGGLPRSSAIWWNVCACTTGPSMCASSCNWSASFWCFIPGESLLRAQHLPARIGLPAAEPMAAAPAGKGGARAEVARTAGEVVELPALLSALRASGGNVGAPRPCSASPASAPTV